MYYISCVGDQCYDYDDDDYDDYDDFDDDCHDDFSVDYYEELVYYNKPLNDFKPLVYDENNSIVNLINNNNYKNNNLISR